MQLTEKLLLFLLQDELRQRDPATLTQDDVTEIVANQLAMVAPMDEGTTEQFKSLLTGMMKQRDAAE